MSQPVVSHTTAHQFLQPSVTIRFHSPPGSSHLRRWHVLVPTLYLEGAFINAGRTTPAVKVPDQDKPDEPVESEYTRQTRVNYTEIFCLGSRCCYWDDGDSSNANGTETEMDDPTANGANGTDQLCIYR